MTDKNLVDLTNEDIISSLEVIATTRNCKIRNCKWGTCNCEKITANAALDLIKCQKAEIERLKSANDEKFNQWNMLAEKTKRHYADLYEEAKDILKVEAYKEFAERIKMSIKANVVETLCNDVKGVYKAEYVLDDVDNLLKEMVSEKE